MPPPSPKILKVGVDIDNTLIVNDTVWRNYFRNRIRLGAWRSKCGHRKVGPKEVATYWDYWEGICAHCFNDCLNDPGLILEHRIRPGAMKTIRDLVIRGVELHLITSRPRKTNEGPTIAWLRRYKLCPPSYFSSIHWAGRNPKSLICAELDLDYMIDDSPQVVNDIRTAAHKCQPILMSMPHNQDVKDVVRVKSWKEVYNYLVTALAIKDVYDYAAAEASGLPRDYELPHFEGELC